MGHMTHKWCLECHYQKKMLWMFNNFLMLLGFSHLKWNNSKSLYLNIFLTRLEKTFQYKVAKKKAKNSNNKHWKTLKKDAVLRSLIII